MASLLEKLGLITNLGVGDIQSDEEMTVVPLIGDDLGDVSPPQALKFTRTSSYGTMVFQNEEDKPAVVPNNMMVRGSGAQDHAMGSSGIVPAKRSKSFENACCIESNQGGMFHGQQVNTDILPIGLRRVLLGDTIRFKREYGKIWSSIESWLDGLSHITRKGRAHLRDFYDSRVYQEQLENFSAAFEPVTKQLGAVILFNGTPVGLEIMPTSEHWFYYWKWLIRGCYASELIRLKELNKIPSSTMSFPDLSGTKKIAEVKDVITSYMEDMKNTIRPMLDSIQVTKQNQIGTSCGLSTSLLRTAGGGGGDIILQENSPIYYSLVF